MNREKFHDDGSVRAFPGYSVISFLDPSSPAHRLLVEIQEDLRTRNLEGLLTVLPPDSLHMTVKDLLCDRLRLPAHWSSTISLDAPLEEAGCALAERLAGLSMPAGLRMRFARLDRVGTTLKPILEPADSHTADKLARLREEISARTGVRLPTHDCYEFHITLAYLVRPPTADEGSRLEAALTAWRARLAAELGVVELPRPGLVFFPHMFEFRPYPGG